MTTTRRTRRTKETRKRRKLPKRRCSDRAGDREPRNCESRGGGRADVASEPKKPKLNHFKII
jgi:hypothetical protein